MCIYKKDILKFNNVFNLFFNSFHQESLESIGKFESYIETLISQLQGIKQKQYSDRQQLVELRDALKNSMSSYKEVSPQLLMPKNTWRQKPNNCLLK